ncbi:MAG: hypothetical protein GY772_28935 [bacterium]|nr:hypothetical protein [bacterium]
MWATIASLAIQRAQQQQQQQQPPAVASSAAEKQIRLVLVVALVGGLAVAIYSVMEG